MEEDPAGLSQMTNWQPEASTQLILGSGHHPQGAWNRRGQRHKGVVRGTQTGNLQPSLSPERARGACDPSGLGGCGISLGPASPELDSEAKGTI